MIGLVLLSKEGVLQNVSSFISTTKHQCVLGLGPHLQTFDQGGPLCCEQSHVFFCCCAHWSDPDDQRASMECCIVAIRQLKAFY